MAGSYNYWLRWFILLVGSSFDILDPIGEPEIDCYVLSLNENARYTITLNSSLISECVKPNNCRLILQGDKDGDIEESNTMIWLNNTSTV